MSIHSKLEKAGPLRSPIELVEAGIVPPERLGELQRVAGRYAVSITPAMVDLIDPTDPDDPIARQFVPSAEELQHQPGERADPIGDHAHMPVPGVVHRYPDRVLLKPIHSCPVYCRFCFRREMVGPGGDAMSEAALTNAYRYIRERPEIFEVIITGGDPFLLSPRRLTDMVGALSAIPHVGVIRFHTRVPITDPNRIDAAFLHALDTEKGLFVAVHANHAREFTASAGAAIARLNRAGAALIGQTVLLRGVNDDPAILADLLRAMVVRRIKPYYLHHPDLAPGTSHFRPTIAEGRAVVGSLRGHISGLCLPTYVLDLPGGHGKVAITPTTAAPGADANEWDLTDFRGRRHTYVG